MFNKTQEEILKRLEEIRQLPLTKTSHLYDQYLGKSIGEAATGSTNSYGCAKERPAIALIGVILSINRNYTLHVEKNIERLKKMDFSSFSDLEKIIKEKNKEEFYNFWGPHDLCKYTILMDVLKTINDLKERWNMQDDYRVMNKWAQEADFNDHKRDILGKIHGIGIATFQHLRMNFGVDTVKPDRQVTKALKREFGFDSNNSVKAIIAVETIAKMSGFRVLEIDQILVNYGSGHYPNNPERIDTECYLRA
ncbi:MAG: hypothetical protein PHH85_03980 [Candidatus Methanoperedens sp.]|nr:hypothetical protein [Candidatus Methanoperedens sp.]